MSKTEYRMAALDMDGTLLNTAHQVSPHSREVLKACAEAGKLIALSTGRCLSELREFLSELPGIAYVIGENGACVYDIARKTFHFQITMDDADVAAILEAAQGLDVHLQAFVGNQSYMQDGDRATFSHFNIGDFYTVFQAGSEFVNDVGALCLSNPGRIEKINLYFPDNATKDVFAARVAKRGVAVSGSIGVGCECSPVGVSKASGLRALCDALDIPIAQTIAIGDGGNDLDILSAAGFSVAMGNAIDSVFQLADAVTDDCDHDGCARALKKYLLHR